MIPFFVIADVKSFFTLRVLRNMQIFCIRCIKPWHACEFHGIFVQDTGQGRHTVRDVWYPGELSQQYLTGEHNYFEELLENALLVGEKFPPARQACNSCII
jgi:hypothetical protein